VTAAPYKGGEPEPEADLAPLLRLSIAAPPLLGEGVGGEVRHPGQNQHGTASPLALHVTDM